MWKKPMKKYLKDWGFNRIDENKNVLFSSIGENEYKIQRRER